jgi:hypothetical protein
MVARTSNRGARRKVVIGGTYVQYRNWLHETMTSNRDALYVGDHWEKLLGLELEPTDVVRLGPVSDRLEDILKSRFR